MSMVINTNVMSLNAQRNLMKTQGSLSTALQRLSSGLRVNSAKDDAAGLAIATRMSSQSRGLTVAIRNANDGLSFSQTAEGAMDEIVNNLQRIRELATQAASGQYGTDDVGYMQDEVDALISEIDRIVDQTRFNDQTVLDGTYAAGSELTVFVSYKSGDDTIDIAIEALDTTALGIDTADLTAAGGGEAAMTAVDTALGTVLAEKSNLGATSNRFEAAIRNLENIIENTEASKSRIMDADFASETAKLTKTMIMQQAGISVLSQANSLPQNVLALLQG